ncbi:M15 family metallopeptidase [Isoptericola jiangsuensis]|uniref:M15 family metallopeptidase n=1 Tax=Isoptericola jiangsuensis TaxID=548579 RepID=UPI003AB037A5
MTVDDSDDRERRDDDVVAASPRSAVEPVEPPRHRVATRWHTAGAGLLTLALTAGFMTVSATALPWNDFATHPDFTAPVADDAERAGLVVGGASPSGPQTIDQVLDVIERAELAAVEHGVEMGPDVQQAAAGLGSLLLTYVAQQDALVDPRVDAAPPADAAAPAEDAAPDEAEDGTGGGLEDGIADGAGQGAGTDPEDPAVGDEPDTTPEVTIRPPSAAPTPPPSEEVPPSGEVAATPTAGAGTTTSKVAPAASGVLDPVDRLLPAPATAPESAAGAAVRVNRTVDPDVTTDPDVDPEAAEAPAPDVATEPGAAPTPTPAPTPTAPEPTSGVAPAPQDEAEHATGDEAEHEHEHEDGPVTFDDVVVAATYLASLLDPMSASVVVDVQPAVTRLPDGTYVSDDGVPVTADGIPLDLARSGLAASLQAMVDQHAASTIGYSNGRIPASVLCTVPWATWHMLRCDAAAQLEALNEAYREQFGTDIPITDSYRSYDAQVAVRAAKPTLAAVPGTSNHGWGLALDLSTPISGGTSAEYAWLRVHGPDYGWDNPVWARPDGRKPEPWHFEFFAAGPIPDRAVSVEDVATVGGSGGSSDDARDQGDAKDKDPKDKGGSTKNPKDKDPKDKGSQGEDAKDKGSKEPEPSPKPSAKPSPSPSPKPTTTPKPDPTPTPSPSVKPSPTPTASPTPSPSPSPSTEPSPTPSSTPTEPAPQTSAPPTDPTPEPSPSAQGKSLATSPKDGDDDEEQRDQ